MDIDVKAAIRKAEEYSNLLSQELPEGWDLLHAFFNAEDDSDFDSDPNANYLTGCIQGIADALGMSVVDLLGQFQLDTVQS